MKPLPEIDVPDQLSWEEQGMIPIKILIRQPMELQFMSSSKDVWKNVALVWARSFVACVYAIY